MTESRVKNRLAKLSDELIGQPRIESAGTHFLRAHMSVRKEHFGFSFVPEMSGRLSGSDIIELLKQRLLRTGWGLEGVDLGRIGQDRQIRGLENLAELNRRSGEWSGKLEIVTIAVRGARGL